MVNGCTDGVHTPVNLSALYIFSHIPRPCETRDRTIYNFGEDVGGSGWISDEHLMTLSTPPAMKYSQ